jgi:hypothetical protein
MNSNFRNRRSLATQLNAIIYAAELLIKDKGRAKGEFIAMPDDLQKDFMRFIGFTQTITRKYESFLITNKTLPEQLPKHLRVALEAYDQTAP